MSDNHNNHSNNHDFCSRRDVLRRAAYAGGALTLSGIWSPRMSHAFLPESESGVRVAPATGAVPNRWAFLVGVGEYQRTDVNWLLGPQNDVAAMHDLLTEKYGFASNRVKILLDKEATRKGILAGWDWLMSSVKPGDQIVFFYSGHGTRIKERVPGSHPGGYESALCPFDAQSPKDLIAGSEIGERIDKISTPHVVVIVDACHSGFASRAPTITPKFISPRLFGQTLPPTRKLASEMQATRDGETAFSDLTKESDTKESDKQSGNFAVSRDRVQTTKKPQKEQCLGAARIDQSAIDDAFLLSSAGKATDNPKMGALTYFLLQELRADTTGTLTYAEANTRVRTALRKRYGANAQEPQLSGPQVENTPFLALAPAAPKPVVPIKVDEAPLTTAPEVPKPTVPVVPAVTAPAAAPNIVGEIIKLNGKTVSVRSLAGATLVPGSIFATVVLPANATGAATKKWVEAEDPVSLEGRALVRVTSAAGTTATATLLSGTPRVGERFVEAFRGAPEGPLRAALSGAASESVRKTIDDLVKTGVVKLVSEAVAKNGGADIAIFADSADKITIYRGTLPLPPVPLAQMVNQLRQLWAVKSLYDLKNTDPELVVKVTANDEEGFADVAIGQTVKLAIEPVTDCHLTILDLAADGKITGTSRFVEAGKSFRIETKVTAPVGMDVVKVFATKNPLKVAIPKGAADIAELGNDSVKIARTISADLRRAINAESQRTPSLKKWIEEDELPQTPATPTRPATSTPAATANGIVTDGWATAELYLRVRQ